MVGSAKRYGQRLVCFDGFGIGKALTVATAEDVHGDRQLISAEIGLAGDLVRIDVDQLDDPVGICAGSGGDEIGDGLSG